MNKTIYPERNYAYGATMLTLRNMIGLTQVELAKYLGISRKAVQQWEAGNSYPKVEHLKELITLALKSQVWPKGSEAEEIRALWKVTHQKVILDEQWLVSLLAPGVEKEEQQDKGTLHPLKVERELRGWSQAKVAEAVNTSVRTVSRWEQGQALPYPYYREQLCALFGKDARELGFVETEQSEVTELPESTTIDPHVISRQMEAWYMYLEGVA